MNPKHDPILGRDKRNLDRLNALMDVAKKRLSEATRDAHEAFDAVNLEFDTADRLKLPSSSMDQATSEWIEHLLRMSEAARDWAMACHNICEMIARDIDIVTAKP